MVLIEACVDALDAALAADAGGADRVELCVNLAQGGVTPSAGLIAATVSALRIPVFVLIRPRTGDFLYSAGEIDVMRRDIEVARSLGAAGIVLGALTAQGDVDTEATRALVAAARPLSVTFHRAFDYARDQESALDALIECGVDRVLTSGGAPSALEGAARLARLRERAAGRIVILAGGSITPDNVRDVIERSGATEVHLRGAKPMSSQMEYAPRVTLARPQPADDYTRLVTRADVIARAVRACGSTLS